MDALDVHKIRNVSESFIKSGIYALHNMGELFDATFPEMIRYVIGSPFRRAVNERNANMRNKSAAERSAIARKAVLTRKRNLTLVTGSNPAPAKRTETKTGKTIVVTKGYNAGDKALLRLVIAGIALYLKNAGIAVPDHLKGEFEAVIAPPPAPEPVQAPTVSLDEVAQLKAIIARMAGQPALPGMEVTPVVKKA